MRTIQSSSYGGFTSDIVQNWITVSDPTKPATRRLVDVLEKFRRFAEEYKQVVLELAHTEEASANLTRQQLEEALGEQLYKALDIYWAPLSQIASQYSAKPYSEELLGNIEMETKINQYLDAINALVGKAGRRLPGILVFFDEITLIHFYPYSDVALVSLPYRAFSTQNTTAAKLSSIAHELGHYLYWHMAEFTQLEEQHKKFMEELERQFIPKFDSDKWWFVSPWVEEIFADVIGAWIGGSSFLESSIARIHRTVGLEEQLWTENDFEHVPNVLRPFVASHVLAKEGILPVGPSPWETFLAARPNMMALEITAVSSDTGLLQSILPDELRAKAEDLIPALEFVVDYILDAIKHYRDQPQAHSAFNFQFAATESMKVLKERAEKTAAEQKKRALAQGDTKLAAEIKAYKILLQPLVNEAEENGTKHAHTYVTFTPHYHSGRQKPHRHT